MTNFSISGTARGMTVSVGPGDDLTLDGAISNQGVISAIGGTGPYNYSGYISIGTVTLSGGGMIILNEDPAGGGTSGVITSAQTTSTLDNVDNTISGGGLITGGASLTITNEAAGTIDATSTTAALNIYSDKVINQGLVESSGGGDLYLNGGMTLDQTGGGTLEAAGAGSLVQLDGATILGGTLTTTGGGVINAINTYNNTDTVVGVGISAGSTVQVLSVLHVQGTITNHGTIALAANSTLALDTPVTLMGGGAIMLATSAAGASSIAVGAAPTLDNVDNTIYGSGTLTGGRSATITNETRGTIDATGATGALEIDGDMVINLGLLESTSPASLYFHAMTLDQTGGGTVLATGAGSVVTFDGGNVIGGTLAATGGGVINVINSYNNANTMTGVTFSTGTLVQDSQNLLLQGTITNRGTLALVATGGNATVSLGGAVTLQGGGAVTLSATTNYGSTINAGASGSTLDNVDNTISGSGVISGGSSLTITNEAGGTIDATGATAVLEVYSDTVNNKGLIESTGLAGLYFNGGVTLNQTGSGTLLAAGAGSLIQLDGVTINGGTLRATGGGVINAINSYNNTDTVVGVAISAGTLVQVISELHLQSTITNGGTIALAPGNGYGSSLSIDGAVVLTGGGIVTLSAANSGVSVISTSQSGSTLDNVNNTISGTGTIQGGGSLTITNETGGTIDATGAGAVLNIYSNKVINRGLVESTGAADLYLNGGMTLDQTGGGTLLAAGLGSLVQLDGATIDGGTLTATGGGVINALNTYNNTDTLVGAGISAGTAVQVVSALHLQGTITNSGAIALAPGNQYGSGLSFDGAVVLTGGGAVTLSAANSGVSTISTAQSGSTLDNVNNTISGGGSITGGSNLAITNEAGGTIDATNPATALSISGNPVVNNGLLESTGGADLALQNMTLDQTGGGKLTANGAGSLVQLSNVTVTGGTLATAGSGVIETTGNVALNGAAVIAGGFIHVDANTTLNAGPSVVLGGDMTVNGTLDIDVSLIANQVFGSLGGSGTVNIDTSGSTPVNASLSVGGSGYSEDFSGFINNGPGVNLGVIKAGNGTFILGGANNQYSNGTYIEDGVLDIAAQGAAGAAPITFVPLDSRPTLEIEAAALSSNGVFANTIAGFSAQDAIEFRGVVTAATYAATSASTGTLTLTNGATTVATLNLSGALSRTDFYVTPAAGSNSKITLGGVPLDFSGDNQSDLLLQNTNGTIVIETQSGIAVTGAIVVGDPGAAWHVVGSADFNGDGQPDILLQNTNGQIVDYLMNGTAIASANYLGNPGAGWHVRGAGDFTGNGQSDILLQNDNGSMVVWYTDGSSMTAAAYVGNPGAGWTVEGVADFAGDGQPDILVQNTNGAIVVYSMSGATIVAGAYLGNPGAGWAVAGTGDYSGNGQADILLHNDNGADVIWDTNGSAVTGEVYLGNPGPAYTGAIAGVDLNGDGAADLVIQGTNSTLVGFTLNANAAITAGAVLGTPGAGWTAMGGDPIQFIDGTHGEANLMATAGADQFDFTTFTGGLQQITGFDPAQDSLALSVATFANFAAVQAREYPYQGGTLIELAPNSSSAAVLIQGITPDQLSTANFVLR